MTVIGSSDRMPRSWCAGEGTLATARQGCAVGKGPMAPVGSGMKKLGYWAATILISDAAASVVLRYAAINGNG